MINWVGNISSEVDFSHTMSRYNNTIFLHVKHIKWRRHRILEQLIQITHWWWLYRNTKVHLKLSNGHIISQHEHMMGKIKDLLWTDPDDMLEDNKALLGEDSGKLGVSTRTNREFWVASTEAAILTAEHKRYRDGITIANKGPDEHVPHHPKFADEGTLLGIENADKNG